MQQLLLSRITYTWLLLVLATASSLALGHGFGFHELRYASICIIVVAFLKARLVILDFMEVRRAPLFMRIIAETWTIIVCGVLLGLYLRAPTAG